MVLIDGHAITEAGRRMITSSAASKFVRAFRFGPAHALLLLAGAGF